MSDPSSRKVAIITGGAGGIGRRCAHALAGAGHDIALVDVLVPEMQRTADEIRAIGPDCLTLESPGNPNVVCLPLAGLTSDRVGRKPLMLASSVLGLRERAHLPLR